MRALLYTILAGVILALAMVVSGPHIKTHGTQWRTTHKPVSVRQLPGIAIRHTAHYFAAKLERV